MKQLNVYFEDKDYKLLLIAKGKSSWRDFILTSIKPKEVRENANR